MKVVKVVAWLSRRAMAHGDIDYERSFLRIRPTYVATTLKIL